MKFGFIAKQRNVWPVAWLCEALGVSRSGFHAWLHRGRCARSLADEAMMSTVRASFVASARTYGARRVWRDVLAEGFACGLHRIERLMRTNALRARPRRRALPRDGGLRMTTVAPNVLDRQFTADQPNRKWIADFTYEWTAEGWLYVAAVIDLFSRRVVGLLRDNPDETRRPSRATIDDGRRLGISFLDCRVGSWPTTTALSIEGLATAIALDIHLQDRGVMDEAIDGCERHGLVWEDLAPFAEWLIGCDHHGPPLVTRGDQLEQDARLGLILGDVGDVVEDKQIVAVELGDHAFEGQFATSNLEPLHEISGADKHHAPPILDQGEPERCRQMALAAARRPEQQDAGTLRQPSIAGRQRHHLSF